MMGYLTTGAAKAALINEAIELGIKTNLDTNLVSDGYHTFGELYEHRFVLFIKLCRFLEDHPYKGRMEVWKSKLHHDGSSYDGWFIMGIGTVKGEQISYHLPLSRWDECDVSIMDRAPEWDGHTPADVISRLKTL